MGIDVVVAVGGSGAGIVGDGKGVGVGGFGLTTAVAGPSVDAGADASDTGLRAVVRHPTNNIINDNSSIN
jgi:hypothetical protein